MPNLFARSGFITGCLLLSQFLLSTTLVLPASSLAWELNRPTIGLALSGGGARGAAHVGVLQALEAQNIPIDYIAGTSMGATVGALYASGYSPAEIKTITENLDWNAAFRDDVERAKRSYRRKKDDNAFTSAVKLGLDTDGIKLPSGIVSGQSIDLILSELLAPVSHIKDFDRLRVPFRAVATDIVTGEEVVMGSGSLALAVRASMSIPGIVTPVEREDRLLIDGGSANNLPISVVKEMGADIIIAVDISTRFLKRKEIGDMVDIANQLSNFLTRRNTEQQIAMLTDQDFLIVPDLGTIATEDFDRVAEAIPVGRSAVEKTEGLERLRHGLPDRPDPRLDLDGRKISFVRLNNHSSIPGNVLENRLTIKRGDPIDLQKIEANVDRLYGLGYFSNVTYNIVEENDQLGVEIVATEKPWGPNYLNVGLRFSTSEDTDNRVSLSADYLMTNMNSLGGELRTGVTLGTDQRVEVDYYQPLDRVYMPFVQPIVSWTSQQVNLFNDDRLLLEFSIEAYTADLGFGVEFGNWGELKLGTRWIDGTIDQRVGPKVFAKESFEDALTYVSLGADTLDSVYFPREGYRFNLQWKNARESLGADQSYEQAILDSSYSQSFSRHSLTGVLRYYRTFNDTLPIHAVYRNGGFLNLSGFEHHQLAGSNFGQVSLVYMYQWEKDLVPVYFGASVEQGNVWQENREAQWDDMVGAYSVFVGADTTLGPFFFAYGYNEEHNRALYLRLDSAL